MRQHVLTGMIQSHSFAFPEPFSAGIPALVGSVLFAVHMRLRNAHVNALY